MFDPQYQIHGAIRLKYRRWGLYLSRRLSRKCTMCGKPKNSYSRFCDYHYEMQYLAWGRYDREHKERVMAKQRRIRNHRRQNGLCITCGTQLHKDADAGYASCVNCREHIHYIY